MKLLNIITHRLGRKPIPSDSESDSSESETDNSESETDSEED